MCVCGHCMKVRARLTLYEGEGKTIHAKIPTCLFIHTGVCLFIYMRKYMCAYVYIC